MSGRLGPRGFAGLAMLLAIAGCAQAFGLTQEVSGLEDFCRCNQLRDAVTECTAFVDAKKDDVAFLRTFVARGCADCNDVGACYALLGAAPDGAACTAGGACASLDCCSDHAVETCCSVCRKCADPAVSPAPHCSPLFDDLAACLAPHLAECPADCSPGGPTAFGDPCFACLAATAAECNQLRFECQSDK